jgi:hypothetical protein
MYPNKYTPEEKLERIKLFMKYDSSKTLNENKQVSEQTFAGTAGYPTTTTSSTTTDQRTPIQKLADDFYYAAAGAGTDADGMVKAVQKIKSPAEFWEVDSFLKTRPKKLDFAQTINDEFEYDNFEEVNKITDHLKKLGVGAEFTKLSNSQGTKTFKSNSFKITSAPVTTTQTDNTTKASTDAKTEKETQKATQNKIAQPAELKDVKAFQDWLDTNHPGQWHRKYQKLESKPERGYGKFGPNTLNAWNNKEWRDAYLKSGSDNKTSSETSDVEITDVNSETY